MATAIERLRGTLACDGLGRPLVLHHGTFSEFGAFGQSSDIGFHFGSLAQARERERGKAKETGQRGTWRIRKVALAAKKVLVIPDDPRSWVNWVAVRHLARAAEPGFLRRLKAAGVTDSKDAALQLRDRIVELGYGAIAYRNLFEAAAGGIADWSWIALAPDAVVDLPDEFRGGVLEARIGASPGLDLPSTARDIPGSQNRNGTIRYTAERMGLIAETERFAERLGGRMGGPRYVAFKDHENSYDVEVPFLGETAVGELKASIGRLSFRVPEQHRSAVGATVDDWIAFAGMKPGPAEHLIYEWFPGETAEGFIARVEQEVCFAAELAAGAGSEPEGAELSRLFR